MRRFLLNNVAIFATKIVLFCRINKKMGNNCDISMINDNIYNYSEIRGKKVSYDTGQSIT